MDGRTDSPCVLQDFVPFGAAALLPLNLNHILPKQGTGTADHLLATAFGLLFFICPSTRPSVRRSIGSLAHLSVMIELEKLNTRISTLAHPRVRDL